MSLGVTGAPGLLERARDQQPERPTVRWDRVIAATIILLPFTILGRGLLPGKVLSPADLFLRSYPWKAAAPGGEVASTIFMDIGYMFHPWLLYSAAELGHGRFPLWNPHVFAGAPFFGALQPALLFPLTALAYVLPAPTALTLITILRFSIAGLGMYWFLRLRTLSCVAAAGGAITFMFSGPMVVWAQWTYASTIMMLPVLFALTECVRGSRELRWVSALALGVGFDLLAGYPQGALYGWLGAAVWALCRARGAAGGGLRFLARFTLGSGLGALLVAVQLLPFLEYARESSVMVYRQQWLPYLSLSLRSAITFLLPNYYGSPTTGDFSGEWNFNETAHSVGLVTWLVLPLALGAAWRRLDTRVFAALALLAGALLYGAPGFGSLLWSLPVLGWGISLRIAPLLTLSLSVLAAVGMEAIATARITLPVRARTLLRIGFAGTAAVALGFLAFHVADAAFWSLKVSRMRQYLWFSGLLTLGALAALRWLGSRERDHFWGGALVLVQLTSLVPLAATYNPVIERSLLYPETPVFGWLRNATASDRSRVLLGQWNLAMLYGLADPTGQDGLTPRRIEEAVGPIGEPRYLGQVGSEALIAPTVLASPALNLLGVRYIVAPPTAPPPAPGLVLEYDGADARVYRNDAALPRAFVVSRARCVDDQTALRLIGERAVELREEALLGAPCADAPSMGAPAGAAWARIRKYGPSRIVIDAETASQAYLMLTDTWFPGWLARVDGAETMIWRADHAFRAVALPPGRHEVEFWYQPRAVWIGLGVTGLAACVILALARLRRRSSMRSIPQVGLGIALLVAASTATAEAAPEPSPLRLTVSPAAMSAGSRATLRIDLEPGRRPAQADARFDLYLVWLFGPAASSPFLTPQGTWSPEPVPLRQGVALADFSPIVMEWPKANPVSRISLALVAVAPLANPRNRSQWLFPPALVWVRVNDPARLRDTDDVTLMMVAGLAVLTLVAGVVVFRSGPLT